MIRLRCQSCRLVWDEDRSAGDSPIDPHAFLCPRCQHCGEIVAKPAKDSSPKRPRKEG